MRHRTYALLSFVLGLSTVGAVVSAETVDCPTAEVIIMAPDGVERVRFTVHVADTPETRAQGLMFVEGMPQTEGMLLLFDEVGEVGFWMKNTLIPLDMLFIDPTGRVATLHEGAIPHDETPIWSVAAVNTVLEINAGEVARVGILPGDQAIFERLDTGCLPSDYADP